MLYSSAGVVASQSLINTNITEANAWSLLSKNIDKNYMFDAPETGRDDVNDIFKEFMNVLQINDINTSIKITYK